MAIHIAGNPYLEWSELCMTTRVLQRATTICIILTLTFSLKSIILGNAITVFSGASK